MRRCRKPGGFAAVFGFLRRLPAAGGVVPRVFWPECGRNGGGVLWEAWKARPRALRVRWAWCGRWMGARTPFPPFPQATPEWRRRVWKAWKARTRPVNTEGGRPQPGGERVHPSHPSHTNHLERKGGLGEWVPGARVVTAPSGGGLPSPTRVVRVVQGAVAHHRAQPPKLLVRDAPLPTGRRLPRLLQLPVVGLHLLVPAQHPPRQEVGGLLQRGPHGAPLTGRVELPGLHVHRATPDATRRRR